MSGLQQIIPQRIPGPQEIWRTLTGTLALSGSSGSRDSTLYSLADGFSACPKPQLSCETRFSGQDTCCFNYPGGQILQTQLWDTDPATGPDDSWTIHGLWPDHCDGGFDQFCDSKRQYSNISLILVDSGRGDLLDYMGVYWKDFRGDDADLWEHEWNKHGTCISTLETKCYSDYLPQQEVVDYFDKTVEIFQKLPSYEILAKAGIVPSHEQTYTLEEIQGALREAHGADATVRCRYGSLNEIWYHFNVAGRLQTGDFVPSDPDGPKSNCPATGIRYLPKRSKSTPTDPSPPTGNPFEGKGYLRVFRENQQRGCVIGRGTWLMAGACATFRTKKVSAGFTLQSRKGPCAFDKNDVLICGPHVRRPSVFTSIDNKLAYNGNTTFFADKAPKGPVQSQIFASSSAEEHAFELAIEWQGK
ncbi:hypothetical protein VTN02DRAFT_6108 [Thermoascus thermophilus]